LLKESTEDCCTADKPDEEETGFFGGVNLDVPKDDDWCEKKNNTLRE
jgi:hypothetical protein